MKGADAYLFCDHVSSEDRTMTAIRNRYLWLIAPLLLLSVAGASRSVGQELPTSKPEDAGVSSAHVAEQSQFMQSLVDDGKIAGGVTVMARHGKVFHLQAMGMADREAGTPMKINSIFRLASMTKAITSVAIMILYDRGKIQLNDPLSKYVPSFKDISVMLGGNPDRQNRRDPKSQFISY